MRSETKKKKELNYEILIKWSRERIFFFSGFYIFDITAIIEAETFVKFFYALEIWLTFKIFVFHMECPLIDTYSIQINPIIYKWLSSPSSPKADHCVTLFFCLNK